MRFGRVGADREEHAGQPDVRRRGRGRAGADRLFQGDHGRHMAKPCAMVDVIGADSTPDELLEGLVSSLLTRAEAEPAIVSGPCSALISLNRRAT